LTAEEALSLWQGGGLCPNQVGGRPQVLVLLKECYIVEHCAELACSADVLLWAALQAFSNRRSILHSPLDLGKKARESIVAFAEIQ